VIPPLKLSAIFSVAFQPFWRIRRCSVKKNDQSEFGIRSETGEIYMLNKKERILAVEILKLTLATEAGRKFR
jgi:hypothetical protein